MRNFQHTQPDSSRGSPGEDPDRALPDFRSSTLQPDPADHTAWLRRPPAPVPTRPRWLVPALLATVLVLTVLVAGFAWQLR